jgi:predicted SprT family Zn-dependent metalloprotease
MENEVFPNDLSFSTQQLRYEIQKNLKLWVDEQVKKFIKPPAEVTVIYEKIRKTRWADTTPKKNNLYTIRLYYGENLERIMDVKSAREVKNMIELFKDSVLHEISHVTTYIKYGPGHKHDRIWKQEAIRVGAIPRRATSPVHNKLARSGERNFKIICEGSKNDSMKFWKEVQRDHRGYFIFDKKTNKPLYFLEKRNNYLLFANTIMECPKCKRKWFVSWNGITNYYCCYDEAKCKFKTLDEVVKSLK